MVVVVTVSVSRECRGDGNVGVGDGVNVVSVIAGCQR